MVLSIRVTIIAAIYTNDDRLANSVNGYQKIPGSFVHGSVIGSAWSCARVQVGIRDGHIHTEQPDLTYTHHE